MRKKVSASALYLRWFETPGEVVKSWRKREKKLKKGVDKRGRGWYYSRALERQGAPERARKARKSK